jgi:DNA polymerase-1
MPENTPRKLVLIDGHALAYRMFFALSEARFSTRQGEPTNATYGFVRLLLTLIGDPNPPDYLAVSFDVGRTFRDDLFADYKGTREKMPDRLQMQIERIQEVLEAFNIPVLVADGYEADDVLGTVARLAGEQGVHTLIVTGDRDLLQLVDEHTTVQLPGRRTGEVDNYDPAAVLEKYGITPAQIVDYKALTGDSSDNIPGVAGIGDKTATALLQEYSTLDEVYANLESISSTRARNALTGSRETAYLSRQLARIVTDVPVDFDLEACRPGEYDRERVLDLFQTLEFRSLVKMIPGGETVEPAEGQQLTLFGDTPAQDTAVEVSAEPPTTTHIVQDEAALDALVERLNASEGIAFDTETTSTDQMQAKLVGISLAVEPGEAHYIPVGHQAGDDPQLPLDLVLDRLRPPLTDPNIPKYGHNIKYDAVIMEQHGLVVSPLSVDTMIGEWLLRPETSRGKLGLKSQAFIRLGIEMTEIEELIGSGRKQITFDLVPIERAAPYAGADADMTLRLVGEVGRDLAEAGQEKLFYEVEMPLVPVLADMEQTGVLVDVDALRRMSAEMSETIAEFQAQIHRIVGSEFNVNSTQQLSEALFEKLRLPTEGLRKTKSGHYSTAADVLESLRSQDTTGVIEAILQYREAEKLKSTYLDALPALVNPQTGRIHSSFNQTGTVTGRISSSDPNLQNIPIRSEVGRRVRDAFIAAPGHVLLAADYSQVELRVLAHVSGDEALRQAFLDDQDIHATTAAAVNGVPLEEVTREQRSFAKAVNFGLLYGMGAFRLARDSGLTLPEAEAFIKRYFERFPRVRAYLDQTLQQAVEQGYVETLLGRRRYFPIFASQSSGRQASIERRAAEREAINMPIQGTAADIIKLAMIQLHDALREGGLRSRMILQVHDELVLEVPEAEADSALALVKEVMSSAYPLDVPLKVDASTGEHWGEVK